MIRGEIMQNGSLSYLDSIRKTKGCENLIDTFCSMCEKDKQKAAVSINSENLQFATLYVLIPTLERQGIKEDLSQRNKIAIDICSKIKQEKCEFSPEEKSKEKTLEWILTSGKNDDGFSDDFDEIIDMAASLLIIIYKSKRVFDHISDLIFQRNRKGAFTHDLVWALLSSQDIRVLESVAQYLKSENDKDVALAANILNLDESLVKKGGEYLKYIKWLGENQKYIKFTGETYQQTSEPKLYFLDLTSKYLGRIISGSENLLNAEKDLVDWFNVLDDSVKEKLANFSHMLNKKNARLWREWISKPVSEQIKTVLKYMGGKP